MKSEFSKFLRYFTFLTVICSIQVSFCSELSIRVGTLSAGQHCDNSLGSRIAGGTEQICVTIYGLTTPRYSELESGIPNELQVLAGTLAENSIEPDDQRFIPDFEMQQYLRFSRSPRWIARHVDSTAESSRLTPRNMTNEGLIYWLSIEVPTQYVGRRIFLLATYETAETGKLKDLTAFDIITPCDDRSIEIIQTSKVRIASQEGRFGDVIVLADSLIALGWHEVTGLADAYQAATRIEDWHTALRFIELNFDRNGRIDAPIFGGDVDQNFDMYQSTRVDLLNKISEENR